MKIKKWLTLSAACLAFSATTAFAQETREFSVSTVLSDAFPWGQAAEKWADAPMSGLLCGKEARCY